MEVRPIHQWELLEDRIIIEQEEAPKITDGGVHIPEPVQERERPARGTVIMVGPGLANDNSVLRLILKFLVFCAKIWLNTLAQGRNGALLIPTEFEQQSFTMPVKIGDIVMYAKQAGLKVTDPATKKDYLIMRVTDIWVRA